MGWFPSWVVNKKRIVAASLVFTIAVPCKYIVIVFSIYGTNLIVQDGISKIIIQRNRAIRRT
jgi:hypothetical protein